jgi:GTP-binding protein
MIIRSAKFITSAVKESGYPRDGYPHVVFAGKSNVGKSSFINSLLNIKKIAKVSQTPGKTRLINFFLINEDFYFVDIPGYGYASVSHQQLIDFATMIDEYLQNPKIKLAVLLLDIRRIPNEDDLLMYEYFTSRNLNTLIVLTKADKLSNNQKFKQKKLIKKALNLSDDANLITYSTQTKENHDLVWESIEKAVESQNE